jgi:hypothetical protein
LPEEDGVGSGQEKGETMTRTGVRLLVGVGLLVSAGCASMADTPPSVDVSGTWGGTWVGNPPSRNGAVTMTLKQSGAEASGNMRVTGAIVNRDGFVRGRVSGNTFTLLDPPDLRATLTVSGDEMKGTGSGQIQGQVALKRQ